MTISHSFRHEDVLGFKFGYQPIGKPRLFAHIYFVDGLLIDTGQSHMRTHIQAETSQLEVEQVFITHHHEDHTGNITPIQAFHGCEVYASEMCCQMMKAPPKLSLAQQVTWGNRPSQHTLRPVHDLIETNHFSFQIIPIPGHAPDMVALYEPDRRWLFSADLYLNSYIDYFIDTERITEQIDSIKRILALEFDAMFCSHKPQFTHGKRQLVKKLDFLESFFEEVSRLHHKSYTPREIFKLMKLRENWPVRVLSGGKLSKLNMIKSVIRDVEQKAG